jgi:hypothetical protein
MSVILPYIAPLLLLLETNTEAKGVDAVARGEVGAPSRTQVRPVVAPGTTPPDPSRARCLTYWVHHWVAGGISRLIPVRGPLPHISIHVKKAPRVGRILTHITGLFEIVSVISTAVPVVISPSRIYVISPRIRSGRARTAGIFPL